ncbi:hypothetical protein V5O48_004381 [Marasmius crinis-equi]|uniref:F-box domain-containing protein n=1 Tax=Marasmius crinis-equi TaxID=585013 RepID=A0ABR3FQ99_9AGAR
MPTLPLEVQILIFHHLKDSSSNFRGYSSTLAVCGLVCRAWVSPSRTALFRRFVLDDQSVNEFLQLYDDPLETFSLARICQLDYQQSEVRRRIYLEDFDQPCCTFNNVLKWQSSDGKRDFATLLSSVEWIELGYFGWDTLDGEGRRRLAGCFASIKGVKLFGTEFHSSHAFRSFIQSLSSLRSLHLDDVVVWAGPDVVTADRSDWEWSLDEEPNCLHTITLEQLSSRDGTNAIESLIPCPSLQNFSYSHYSGMKAHSSSRAAIVGRLLSSAGNSLEQLSITTWSKCDETTDENTFRTIDLSLNPNIRRIDLSIQASAYLNPFLERLIVSTGHAAGEPCLQSLSIEHLPQLELDWGRLDNLLQHSFFSALREISCEMYLQEPEAHDESLQSVVPRAVVTKVEEFRSRLPQCERRGILKINVKYE